MSYVTINSHMCSTTILSALTLLHLLMWFCCKPSRLSSWQLSLIHKWYSELNPRGQPLACWRSWRVSALILDNQDMLATGSQQTPVGVHPRCPRHKLAFLSTFEWLLCLPCLIPPPYFRDPPLTNKVLVLKPLPRRIPTYENPTQGYLWKGEVRPWDLGDLFVKSDPHSRFGNSSEDMAQKHSNTWVGVVDLISKSKRVCVCVCAHTRACMCKQE